MTHYKNGESKDEAIGIEASMTLYEVADIHQNLIRSFEKRKEVIIDLANIIDCDTSGIQLLCSLLKTAKRKGIPVSFPHISEAVRKAAEEIGVVFPGDLRNQGG